MAQDPRVLHIDAKADRLRASLEDAGFTLTVAANVDDLDITLPAGTYFGSILLIPESLSVRQRRACIPSSHAIRRDILN